MSTPNTINRQYNDFQIDNRDLNGGNPITQTHDAHTNVGDKLDKAGENVHFSRQNSTTHKVALGTQGQEEIKDKVGTQAPEAIASALAKNLEGTAEDFIKNSNVITNNFCEQISGLKAGLESIKSGTYGNGESSTAKGLVELNSFIERYNSDGLGGFERTQTTGKFFSAGVDTPLGILQTQKDTTKALEKALEKFNDKDFLGELNLKKPEDLKKLKEKLEGLPDNQKSKDYDDLHDKITKKLDADKKAQGIELAKLNEQINERLDQLSKAVAKPATNAIERMLNLMQQVGFSAWLINDIIPAFGEKDNPLSGLLSPQSTLNAIKDLNKEARNTPMFSELNFKADKEPKEEAELLAAFGKTLKGDELATFEKFEGIKMGLRGRSNDRTKTEGTHTLKVPTKPLYNTKNDDKNPYITEETHKKDIYCLKTGFVPTPTARGDAIPEEFMRLLNNHKGEAACKALINHLKEKKVIEEKNGNLVSKPSFAKIIDEAGLPTYCSVSGTTGEIVSTLVHVLDTESKQQLQSMLNLLLKLSQEGPSFFENNTNKAVELNGLSKFFAPIASFMEIGHFHTTAEVLGGFYSVAVANANQEQPEDMVKGFNNLLDVLKQRPDIFLGN